MRSGDGNRPALALDSAGGRIGASGPFRGSGRCQSKCSSCRTSSALGSRSSAAMAPSRCCIFVAPMIGAGGASRDSSQAGATRAGGTSRALAVGVQSVLLLQVVRQGGGRGRTMGRSSGAGRGSSSPGGRWHEETVENRRRACLVSGLASGGGRARITLKLGDRSATWVSLCSRPAAGTAGHLFYGYRASKSVTEHKLRR